MAQSNLSCNGSNGEPTLCQLFGEYRTVGPQTQGDLFWISAVLASDRTTSFRRAPLATHKPLEFMHLQRQSGGELD